MSLFLCFALWMAVTLYCVSAVISPLAVRFVAGCPDFPETIPLKYPFVNDFLRISQVFPRIFLGFSRGSQVKHGHFPALFPRPVLLSLSTSRGQLQRRFHSAAAAAQWLRSSCDVQRLDEELGSTITGWSMFIL